MPNDNSKRLIGRRITDVFQLDPKAAETMFGHYNEFEPVFVILLDDETVLMPLRDCEGNGPGALEIRSLKNTQRELLWTNEVAK